MQHVVQLLIPLSKTGYRRTRDQKQCNQYNTNKPFQAAAFFLLQLWFLICNQQHFAIDFVAVFADPLRFMIPQQLEILFILQLLQRQIRRSAHHRNR